MVLYQNTRGIKKECLKLKEYNIFKFSTEKITKLIEIDRNKVDRILRMRQ